MSKKVSSTDTTVFTDKLADYKHQIDADIDAYSKQLERQTIEQFGSNAHLEMDAYLQILARGGKRIRGALAMVGYEMAGGQDKHMIVQVARALEMLHAYILIIDDFQDRSAVRRGGPTAHVMLARYHRQQELAGGSEHFGSSLALNAALSGAHSAQQILLQLDVAPDLKLRATESINQTMVVTAHGQTNDIMNEVVADVSEADIERVLEWKTAHYTFLNPLTAGMILAGADEPTIAAITDYAVHAGKAFQITDDCLGIFGTEFDSGKSPFDDVREGKRTILTEYALGHADDENKNFLVRMLGKTDITPIEFDRVKAILVQTGALAHAQELAADHITQSLASLAKNADYWSDDGVAFLSGLAKYLAERKT